MPMTRDEIFAKVRTVLVDALSVEEEEVTPEASLTADLNAESIDFLDIGFRLEKAFGFKIADGELFPQGVTQDPDYVQNGLVTPKGIAALKDRLPHVDFGRFEADPKVSKVAEVFTVEALVNFVESKLKAGA